jgi:hypothetical protein
MMPDVFQGVLSMILRSAAAGFFCLLVIMSSHLPCLAGTSEEIASLLLFVEQSGCTFIRNGKHYEAPAARRHIEKKYAYFKERVNTAEEFIQYSATKSTLSDKPYTVICNGEVLKSSDWLIAELHKLRTRPLEENHETPDNNPAD